jgi:hypothetical protein
MELMQKVFAGNFSVFFSQEVRAAITICSSVG